MLEANKLQFMSQDDVQMGVHNNMTKGRINDNLKMGLEAETTRALFDLGDD